MLLALALGSGVLLQASPGSVGVTSASVGTQITGLSTLIQVQGSPGGFYPKLWRNSILKALRGGIVLFCQRLVFMSLQMQVYFLPTLVSSGPLVLGCPALRLKVGGGIRRRRARWSLCDASRAGLGARVTGLSDTGHSGVCPGAPAGSPKAPETPPLCSTSVLPGFHGQKEEPGCTAVLEKLQAGNPKFGARTSNYPGGQAHAWAPGIEDGEREPVFHRKPEGVESDRV